MEHLIDKVCSCSYCMMIDAMWGDPNLNAWESKFVNSIAHQGWRKDYSQKQKTTIKRTFEKQKQKYTVG